MVAAERTTVEETSIVAKEMTTADMETTTALESSTVTLGQPEPRPPPFYSVLDEHSAADTEAAHELLSLAQSVPPVSLANDTVNDTRPVYAYTIQPSNIFILTEDPPDGVSPIPSIDYVEPSIRYVTYQTEEETNFRFEELQFVEEVSDFMLDQVEGVTSPDEKVVEANPTLSLPPSPLILPPLDSPPLVSPPLSPTPLKSPPLASPPLASPPLKSPPLTSPPPTSTPMTSMPPPPPPTSSPPRKQKTYYVCDLCDKRYMTSSNLSRHKQTHRSLDSNLAKRCDDCGKVYVSMPALAMHVLTHRMGHVCGLCGKQFSRPWLLRGHLRAHTGEKPYVCKECGRSFGDRSNLRAHLMTHSGEKKFECQHCLKTFLLKPYLIKHQEHACARAADDN